MFRLRPFWCWLFTGHYWDETSVKFSARGVMQKCHICGATDRSKYHHDVQRAARQTRSTNRGGAKTRGTDHV